MIKSTFAAYHPKDIHVLRNEQTGWSTDSISISTDREVEALALNHDESHLAAALGNGELKIWNVATGILQYSCSKATIDMLFSGSYIENWTIKNIAFRQHEPKVVCIMTDYMGAVLGTEFYEGVFLWNFLHGSVEAACPTRDNLPLLFLNICAISPNGNYVAVKGDQRDGNYVAVKGDQRDGSIQILDLNNSSWRHLTQLAPDDIDTLKFSPDGTVIVARKFKHKCQTPKPDVSSMTFYSWKAGEGPIYHILEQISGDFTDRFAVGHYGNQLVHFGQRNTTVYDFLSGNQLWSISKSYSGDYSLDGKYLVVYSGRELELLGAATGDSHSRVQLRERPQHVAIVMRPATKLASYTTKEDHIQILNITTSVPDMKNSGKEIRHIIGLLDKEYTVVIFADAHTEIWSTISNELLWSGPHIFEAVISTPNGLILIEPLDNHSNVMLWKYQNSNMERLFLTQQSSYRYDYLSSSRSPYSIAPAGGLLASTRSGVLFVVDLEDHSERRMFGDGHNLWSPTPALWSASGTEVASILLVELELLYLSVWDVATGSQTFATEVFPGESSGKTHLSWLPDGQIMVTLLVSGTIPMRYHLEVWSLKSKKLSKRLSFDIGAKVFPRTELWISPDHCRAVIRADSYSKMRYILLDINQGNSLDSLEVPERNKPPSIIKVAEDVIVTTNGHLCFSSDKLRYGTGEDIYYVQDWVMLDDHRFMWIPQELRRASTYMNKCLTLASYNGGYVTLKFQTQSNQLDSGQERETCLGTGRMNSCSYSLPIRLGSWRSL